MLNRAPGQTNDWNAGTATTYTYTPVLIPLKEGNIARVDPPVNGVIVYHLLDDNRKKTSVTVAAVSFALLIALVATAAARGVLGLA